MPRTVGRQPPLRCPGCGARYPARERFCNACALPLVSAEAAHEASMPSARHRQARQIKPQLSDGNLVRVIGASNLAEAEFIQSLLLEEGVPSLLRRSAGFDVPDMLAAGPRDVLVPASGVDVAREVLLQAELVQADRGARPVAAGRLLAGLLLALAAGALLLWLVSLLAH